MSNRIVEIANPARLSIRDAQLAIEREGLPPFTTPISGILSLLLAHPQITLTQAVVSHLAEAGAMLVTIDHTYRPVAMMLPLQAHHVQTMRLAAQANLKQPTQKRLWAQIVKAKIRAQGNLLKELRGSDQGILATATRVRSGDPHNLEAQAARVYWGLIFGNPVPGHPKFRRGADPLESGPDQNRHLDYGYTVLRAAMARAICAAGLHPSMGLRHHNRFDPFSLASDMMEPFRPLIDHRVAQWIEHHDETGPLDTAVKRWIIESITARYSVNKQERVLSDILFRFASSFADVLTGNQKNLEIFDVLLPCRNDSISPPTDVCG